MAQRLSGQHEEIFQHGLFFNPFILIPYKGQGKKKGKTGKNRVTKILTRLHNMLSELCQGYNCQMVGSCGCTSQHKVDLKGVFAQPWGVMVWCLGAVYPAFRR